MAEHRETFACFGSECTVIVASARSDDASRAVAVAKRRLLDWHRDFSRFEPASELSRLNADRRGVVPVSSMMGRLLAAAVGAAELTGGLVDAALIGELEHAGYGADLRAPSVPLEVALGLVRGRAPARPRRAAPWSRIEVDRRAGVVIRDPGVRFDSGGIAKGVFADELGGMLGDHDAYAVDCAGDIRLGGRAGDHRHINVASPFDGSTLHTFECSRGAIATSGIGKRSWIGADGRPAHHLLDPSTGSPAFTGIVQVTALAPSATQAEVASKAALLSGPGDAPKWLEHGGVIVLDDGSHRVLRPRPERGRPATRTGRRAHAAARAH